MFKTILFPIDPSRETWETTFKAIELAKNHQSHIILLSVVKPNQDVNNQELTISKVKRIRKQMQKANINFNMVERHGKPDFVICDVADNLNVDLIVMSTKGVNLESNNKSTAAKVMDLAPCPVLVMP